MRENVDEAVALDGFVDGLGGCLGVCQEGLNSVGVNGHSFHSAQISFEKGLSMRGKYALRVQKGSLGDGGDFWFILPVFLDNAFAFVVAAKLVDFCFQHDHVAFVVGVFLVAIHVDCHALGFPHEVGEVFRHSWGEVCGFEGLAYAFARDGFG